MDTTDGLSQEHVDILTMSNMNKELHANDPVVPPGDLMLVSTSKETSTLLRS